MLKFILGRAGSGKSGLLHKILKEKLNKKNSKIILIVPEQSSFRSERHMLKMLGDLDFNKIEVLSFSRLYDFVSKKLNAPAVHPDSETMQLLIMNAAVENVKENLKLYKNNSCCAETALLMLKILKEFKSHKINFEVLDKIQTLTNKDTLKQKISEIKLIINSYESISQKKFEDSIDNLSNLEMLIKQNNVFKDYDIFIDEFNSFTPQQLSILECIIKQAENTYLALCADKMPNKDDLSESNLFAGIYKTILKICEIAKNYAVEIKEPTVLQNNLKFENGELKTLEKNIFLTPKSQYNDEVKNITLYNAANKLDECEYVAKTIKKLIIEKNYRYRDFAVLTRNLENYSNTLKYVFDKYNISYFLNSPSKIYNKSTTLTVFATLDAVISNYDLENILRFLKSGLTDLSAEEISDLENYVLLWNISGKDWNQEFTMHPEGFSEKFEEKDNEKLLKLNMLRKKIILPLKNLKQKIKNATGLGISKAIYEMLLEINAPENLRKICAELTQKNEKTKAEQEAKTWDILIKVLGDIASVFKDIKITPKKYSDILFSVISSLDVSSIPQSVDSVIIDASNLARLSSPKAVFILGAIDGEFPKDPGESEIFTDDEINHIASLGIEIANDNKNFLVEEKFLSYIALFNASEKLFLSWPNYSMEKEENLPSEIINEIKEIFPKIKVLNKFNYTELEEIWCEKAAFEIFAKNIKSNKDLSNALKNYFLNNENYKSKCLAIADIGSGKLKFKEPENAKKLFPGDITLSSSQIEKYYSCAFEYFCKYILKIKPQKRAEFNGLEYGNIMHYILENMLKKYQNKGLLKASTSEIQKSISEITERYTEEKLGGIKNKNSKFLYLIKRLKQGAYFLADHFIEEFKQSLFKVSDLELTISSSGKVKPLSFTLPDKTTVKIEGKIDRIDVMETNSGSYVRVIDYKTGSKSFKLSDLIYGLNMQMLIYLITLQKNGYKKYKHILPAGALYFTAIKPNTSAEYSGGKLEFEKKIQDKLKMSGLLLNDLVSIEGMEEHGGGKFIPAKINKGVVDVKSSVITLGEFEIIASHIKHLVTNMAMSLKSGKIGPTPITSNKKTSCVFCDYLSVCKYEENNFKNIDSKLDKKEIFKKISPQK